MIVIPDAEDRTIFIRLD